VRILVVQHDPDKPLGRIADGLVDQGVTLDARMATSDLPGVAEYDGVVVLPGLANPDDDDPALHRARGVIEQALERAMPTLGLCLGGQLLVQVLGGTTYECPPELGYHDVSSTEAARTDPLFGDAPARFAVFHAHAYAFEPPRDATVLLTNDVCTQACRLGDSWAIQCHPEVTTNWVAGLALGIRGQPHPIDPRTPTFFRQHHVDPDALERAADLAAPTAHRVAQGIASGFASRCRAYARAGSHLN
jgi:GMP synthase (glutamine-hydrolysing)